jgi:hypothetical protein
VVTSGRTLPPALVQGLVSLLMAVDGTPEQEELVSAA